MSTPRTKPGHLTPPVIQIPEYPHAILSPSKAHMWLSCTGSLAAGKGVRKPPSKFAAEGTAYHDVARRALVEGKDCAAYVGDRYHVGQFEFVIDEDNAEEAQKYVEAVRAIPGKRFVEVNLEYHQLLGVPKEHQGTYPRLHPSGEMRDAVALLPVASGTADAVVLDYENRIVHVMDLKFGRGDIVYASEAVPGTDRRTMNYQLALYAAAAAARYELLGIDDTWTAKGYICQPRAHHYDSHDMPVGELLAWVQAQRQGAQAAYALWCQGPDSQGLLSVLDPGEKQCRWCPISGNCKAQDEKILGQFPKGHAEKAIPTLVQLSTEELADALDRAEEVAHWLSAVRAEGLSRAMRGDVLPNWKLVQGRRGNRALPEDVDTTRVELSVEALTEIGVVEATEPSQLPIKDALDFAMGEGAYTKKLKTVAQLEKPLAKRAPLLWAALQAHITQADGKPSLERMEDPRPPLPILTQEFPNVETSTVERLL